MVEGFPYNLTTRRSQHERQTVYRGEDHTILKEHESGVKVPDLVRKHNVSVRAHAINRKSIVYALLMGKFLKYLHARLFQWGGSLRQQKGS